MNAITIWSKRWCASWGWRWVSERQSTPEDVEGWLTIFRADEPKIVFIAAKRKPKCVEKQS